MSAPLLEHELLRAQLLLEAGRWEESAQAAGAMTVSAPGDVRPWRALAWALLEGEDVPGAVSAARGALALVPHDVDALLVLSEGLRGRDPRRALATAQAALAADPHRWNTHAQVASCLADLGRRSKARRALASAEALAPTVAEVHVVAASVHLTGRALGRARCSARRALELDPANGHAMDVLALVEVAAMNTREAAALVVASGRTRTRPARLGRMVDVVVVRWAESAMVWLAFTLVLTAIFGFAALEVRGAVWQLAVLPAVYLGWLGWTARGLSQALSGSLGSLLRRKIRDSVLGRVVGTCAVLVGVAILLVCLGPAPSGRLVGVVLSVVLLAVLFLLGVVAVIKDTGVEAALRLLALFVVFGLPRLIMEIRSAAP